MKLTKHRFGAAAALLAALTLAAVFLLRTSRRPVTYVEARAVIERRCVECHSAHPTSRAFPIAPKGIRFDTVDETRQHAGRIRIRVVVERTMPLANMTSMTDEEREVLGAWVEQGAPPP